MKEFERKLLDKIDTLIEQNINNPNFQLSDITNPMNMSRVTLYRNLTKWTGNSPNIYIRKIRLSKAKQFLEEGHYSTVKETAFAVGFNNPSYFSKLFHQMYGITPKELLIND